VRERRDFVLSGGIVYLGIRELCKIRLWKRISPLGNLEGGSFTGDYERQMKEGSGNGASLSTGDLRGEPRERAPLQGILKDK
jgi:hypothetical protein